MNTLFTNNFNFFIVSILFTTLVVSCGPNSSSEGTSRSELPSEPSEPAIVSKEISYQVDATEFSDSAILNGYLAHPALKGDTDDIAQDVYPGILVVHEWWGHNDYARSRADELAELGYVALAVDMYGDGKQASHPEDAQTFAGQVLGNIDLLTARFHAALNILKEAKNVDSTSIGAIGYCMGGSIVLTMANVGTDLDAVAAFHAGLQLPAMPSEEVKIQAQILVANGADDPFISAEQVETFKTAMDAASANYEYIAYEGAVHAFTNPEADTFGKKFNLPLAYNQKADEQSWEAMQALFNEVF